ncbi:hypothetical protein [Halococcus thailandensis]|uniref:hypothetical protein n=1 Tax=Halococcus thailandensis TaxID=335952 RepID=UPI0009B5C2BE|nr:hypothetical protein [Halococcus thailandensis]
MTEGENATANVTIANKGNSTRTFRGLIESRVGDNGNWGGVAPITSRVRPGQSIQQNVSVNSSADGSVSYRLAPFNQTKTVEYVPPTFALGRSYTTTENVRVTVSNLQTAQSVQISGKDSRRTPPSGERFVLAKVQAVAVGESEGTPRSGEFALKANGRTFSQEDGLTNPLTSPVEGTPYGGVYDPNSGRTYSWYAVWTAPEQISTDAMTVQWTSREESSGVQGESARWTKDGSNSP